MFFLTQPFYEPSEVFARITGVRKLFGRRQGISRCWMLSMPYVLISKPECVEVNWSSFRVFCGAWAVNICKESLKRRREVLSRCLRSMLTNACGDVYIFSSLLAIHLTFFPLFSSDRWLTFPQKVSNLFISSESRCRFHMWSKLKLMLCNFCFTAELFHLNVTWTNNPLIWQIFITN
jgi:hypothetical protein